MYKSRNEIIEEINKDIILEFRKIECIFEMFIKLMNNDPYSYTTALDDLFMGNSFGNLLNEEWGANILSDTTWPLLKKFYKAWIDYRKSTSFGEEGLFVVYDEKWQNILVNFLQPLTESLEDDLRAVIEENTELNSNEMVQVDKYSRSRVIQTPKKPEIPCDKLLEQVALLYQLLYDKKILDKSYLDNHDIPNP